jgi:uncharacterized protein
MNGESLVKRKTLGVANNQPETRPSGNQKQHKRQKTRQRAVPQRTCVGCRTVNAKRAMVRVVRTPEGAIELDPTGKQSGRGAYLCQRRTCWERALERRSLDHALKTKVDEATRAGLLAFAATLEDEDKSSTPRSSEPRAGESASNQ